jgi:RluA family pseudouridine synthase
MPTAQITNISSYQFATLTDLKLLRERLLYFCKELNLRGTILLSTEGINLFIAGEDAAVKALLKILREISGLETLQAKFSYSAEQPFRRMLVRIKKEIITFGVEGIQPGVRTSPKLKAAELKQWLDEGRPITLLDTRNDYEVKLGTFHGAKVLPITHFRQFPDAVRALPEEMKQQPIVMFCTGGIRCEKAGPFMEQEGFKQIYQLDGGILRYFEEVGSAHYDGECFVFDQRTGLDPTLAETGSNQCYACQTPLTAEEQADPRYVENVSCPYCFKTSEEQLQLALEARQQKLRSLCTPLPGSVPHDLRRPLHVPAACDQMTVIDTLSTVLPQVGREEWLRVIEAGRILRRADDSTLSAKDILRAGEQILHFKPQQLEPEVNADIQLLYEDAAIIVLQKPAPLPIHAGGRFTLNTLTHLIQLAYSPERPRPAHRLDSDTTGIMVLTRTRHFAGILQPQFSRGEVDKVYLLRVYGHPSWENQRCEAQISQQKAIRTVNEEEGDDACTEFKVLRRDADSSLLEARPLTGRTNQIRLHAWHLGYPIIGDPVYLQGGQLTQAKGLTLGAAPLCLHAWKLSFQHPLTRELVSFETEQPNWAKA